MPGEIERIRQTMEDTVSLTNMRPLAPVRLNTHATAQGHNRQFVFSGLKCPGTLRGQAAQLEMNVVPASQFRRYLDDYIRIGRVAGMDNQVTLVVLAHRSTPINKAQ